MDLLRWISKEATGILACLKSFTGLGAKLLGDFVTEERWEIGPHRSGAAQTSEARPAYQFISILIWKDHIKRCGESWLHAHITLCLFAQTFSKPAK